MNDIQIEKTLYRIIQGRLRFKRDGLVLYIQEPTKELMYESYEIYDDAYDLAYKRGNYIKPEVLQILVEQDLWTPLDDKQAKEYEKTKKTLNIIRTLLNRYSKKQLIEMIEKESNG